MSSMVRWLEKSDFYLFQLFNTKLHCKVLNILMRGITELGSTLFAVSISSVLILFKPTQGIGIKMAILLIVSQIVVQSLKRIISRERPFVKIEQVQILSPTSCVYSFPSGHTSAAFCIALTLSDTLYAASLFFMFIACLVGVSRVYNGVHYFTDVMMGAVISYVCYIGYHFLY